MCRGKRMRGAQYNFNDGYSRRRRGRSLGYILLFALRATAFLSALFCIILYWPADWMERLISFLEWLRYR